MPSISKKVIAGLAVATVLAGGLLLALKNMPASGDEALVELGRITVGAEPLGIDVAADGSVIVAAAGARSLHVLDPGTLQEKHRLDLSAHGRLSRVFVDRASGDIFVTASVQGQVLKLDPSVSSVKAAATTGGFPQGLAQAGDKLLVALTSGQAVAVLDRATVNLVRSIDAGDRPNSIHLDRNGKFFYVVKSTTRSVWVFDADSLKWIRAISDPSFVRPSGLAQAPNGRLLMLDAAQDALLVMDEAGAAVEARVPLLPADCTECTHVPMALAVSPDGSKLAVAGRGGWVSLLDLETLGFVSALQVGSDLRGVVWAGDNRIFATSFGSAEVVIVGERQN